MVAESPAASPVSAVVPAVAVAEAHRVRLRLPKFRGQETLLGAANREIGESLAKTCPRR